MKKYAIKRILQLIPILFAITFLSYGMMRIAGSDVVTRKMENTGGVVSERVPVCINREKVFLKIENIFQIRIAYNPLGGL